MDAVAAAALHALTRSTQRLESDKTLQLRQEQLLAEGHTLTGYAATRERLLWQATCSAFASPICGMRVQHPWLLNCQPAWHSPAQQSTQRSAHAVFGLFGKGNRGET
jgi:hypothetical protein